MTRRLSAAALIGAGVIWAGHVVTALRYPLGSDASIFQYFAFLMDNGVVPYRDVAEMNTPGILLFHWGAAQVIGLSDSAFIGLVMALCTIALLGSLWMLRARATRIALALGSAVALWAFVSITPWDRGQRELLGGLFLAVAIALGSRAVTATGRPGWSSAKTAGYALAAGVAAGIAITIKVTIVVVVWAAWAVWLLQISRAHRGYRGVRHSLAGALASMLGVMIPIVGVLGWLHINGALGHFWHVQATILPAHADSLLVPMGQALSKPLPIFLLALGIAAVANEPRGRGLRTLGAVHLAVVGTYLIQRHGWTYHLHVSLPLVLPTVVLLMDDWLPKARWATPAALVVTAALLLKVSLMVGYDYGEGMHRAVQVGGHWNHQSMQEVAEIIRKGPKSDTVLTNNDEHQLLLMAERLPATPFLYGFLFSESHPDEGLKKLGMARVDVVHRTAPQWVVWNTRPFKPELDSLEANPTLAAWLEARCDEYFPVSPPYRLWSCPEF